MAGKKIKTAEAPAAETLVSGIKGFNRDLTCIDFQFEVGKTYEVAGKIEACRNGFHAIPDDQHPLSVFGYYAPATSVFHEVQQGGTLSPRGDKLCSASITIGVEISLSSLIARAIEWVWDRAIKTGESSATGPEGAASATGPRGAASATGTQGAASATGPRGAASATGPEGAASATGYQGAASATGPQGAATSSGYQGRVMGSAGNALFAVERDVSYAIISVACGIAGRDGIKADTWYRCRSGKLVEA